MSNSLQLPDSSIHGIFLGKNTGVVCHFLLQGIFPTQGSNPGLLHYRQDALPSEPPGKPSQSLLLLLLLLLLSRFSRFRLCVIPWTAAYQAPPSMGFSGQQYWSGVPLPSLSQSLSRVNSIFKISLNIDQISGEWKVF